MPLLISLSVLATTIFSGTLGYRMIEGWTLFDAFYMTVITLATVGYREVHDLSEAGKIFTVVLIIFGAGIIAYAVGSHRHRPEIWQQAGTERIVFVPHLLPVFRGILTTLYLTPAGGA